MFYFICAFIFTLHLFFSGGYLARGIFPMATSSNPSKNYSIFPNALELIIGYALTALCCFFSLFCFGSMIYGAGIITICSLVNCIFWFKKNHHFHWRFHLTPILTVKAAFIICIAVIYLPCFIHSGTQFQLPIIFDLPKHIGAIIASSHATQWPAPNPYFPELSFAYNLLFYLPLGLIIRLTQSAELILPLFAWAVVWLTWQALSLLELTMQKFSFSKRQQLSGIFFATFLSNLTPLFVRADSPMGYLLKAQGWADFYVDTPFVSFLFVPQHLFSILCILSAWLVYNKSFSRPYSFLFASLLLAAVLSSFMLAPLAVLIFSCLMLLNIKFSGLKNNKWDTIICSLFFLILSAYFMWEAAKWANSPSSLFGFPNHFGYFYVLLSEAPLIIGCLCSYSFVKSNLRDYVKSSYFLICLIALGTLLISHDSDFNVKITFFLSLFLIIPAVAGYSWCWNKLGRWWGEVILVFPLFYLFSLSVIQIGFFWSHSFIPRSPSEQLVLRNLQKLPFDANVLFLNPDMDKAAVGGHQVFMDFSTYREDSYLPVNERNIAKHFFHSRITHSEKSIGAFLSQNELVITPASDQKPVFSTTSQKDWFFWSGKPQLKLPHDTQMLYIESQSRLVDAALITPLKLSPGSYQIIIEVKGDIIEGTAHLSLLGVKKLINIPSSNYNKSTKFYGIFEINQPGFEGNLAFGLGGWGLGKGSIQLTNLTIYSVSKHS